MLLRRMWREEVITFESGSFSFRGYYNCYGLRQIPIYFGVRGVRMLKLAGRVADGVILSGPKTYIEKAVEVVRSSAREGGRTEGGLSLVVCPPTFITFTAEELKLAREVATIVLVDTLEGVLKASGIDLETVEAIRRSYLREGVETASRLLEEDVLDEMLFYGEPQELCESFLSLEKLGVNEVVFGPPFGINRELAVALMAEAWRREGWSTG